MPAPLEGVRSEHCGWTEPHLRLSIHPLSISNYPLQGCRGLGAITGDTGLEVGYAADRSSVPHLTRFPQILQYSTTFVLRYCLLNDFVLRCMSCKGLNSLIRLWHEFVVEVLAFFLVHDPLQGSADSGLPVTSCMLSWMWFSAQRKQK